METKVLFTVLKPFYCTNLCKFVIISHFLKNLNQGREKYVFMLHLSKKGKYEGIYAHASIFKKMKEKPIQNF